MSMGFFSESKSKVISAVLYRHKSPLVTSPGDQSDVLIIHNPNASFPISPEEFPIGLHRIWDFENIQTVDQRGENVERFSLT
jgi:hypothetical protein